VMLDKITAEQRSRTMRAVRRKDTAPEMVVRRLLHSAGYRYRLHDRSLPGSPDLTFPKRRKAIFVHGCFWHGHNCRTSLSPQSRQDYWQPKLRRNQLRDLSNLSDLKALGWQVMAVWECETRPNARPALLDCLCSFLGSTKA